jgi:hypothetical protein
LSAGGVVGSLEDVPVLGWKGESIFVGVDLGFCVNVIGGLLNANKAANSPLSTLSLAQNR